MSAFFGIWKGPNGLIKDATRLRFMAQILYQELANLDIKVVTNENNIFDTITIDAKESGLTSSDFVIAEFHKFGSNLRRIGHDLV